jgi:hypothetical protein
LLLSEVANRLWPHDSQAEEGLQALLEIAATAKQDDTHEDLLPTRLHYFVRAQDGLHVCLHQECPGRRDGKPAFFVSRKNDDNTPEGICPACSQVDYRSKLVEVVTCRKCGYLYGALQDLGPRRAQNPETGNDTPKPQFDSFTTELGWAADSFCHISVWRKTYHIHSNQMPTMTMKIKMIYFSTPQSWIGASFAERRVIMARETTVSVSPLTSAGSRFFIANAHIRVERKISTTYTVNRKSS